VERIPELKKMAEPIPIVTKIRALGARMLRVHFAGDRRDYRLDLTGLFARSRHFAPLLEDAVTFAKVGIIEDGIGIAWPIETKWGPLDISASTLRRIADEQLPMTGADFSAWRQQLGLSLSEASKLLGVSRRTIMSYLKKSELPAVVAIACRALARDKHVLAAHYVPARKTTRHAA
jgi:DNA-binding XRE family transcriptional regulator